MRARIGLSIIATLLIAPRSHALQVCHDPIDRLAAKSSIVVIATLESIGTRTVPACPEFKKGVPVPAERRCGGALQTLDLHVDQRLKGSAPQNITVTVPDKFLFLTCDDPPTIRPGSRLGLFLNDERDGYWVVSGISGIFDADEWFLAQVRHAIQGEVR